MIITEEWIDFNGRIGKVVTKIVKVKVIKQFNDRTAGFITRPVNEVYECSDDRATELISKGFATQVDEKPKKTKSTD